MADYEWLNLDEDEQISFVMYGSYEEQIQFLNNEQLGQLIRNVFHYVRTGEQKDEEPIINMALSMIAKDIRYQKRNQKKRSEAASKAAKTGVEKRANEKAAKEKKSGNKKASPKIAAANAGDCERTAATASEEERMRAIVSQDVDEDVDEEMDADEDVDVDELLNPDCCYSGGGSTGACDDNGDELIHYGENQHLTTVETIQQTEALTRELFQRYMHRKPTQHDCEKAFGYLFEFRDLNEETHYGVYSPARAQLLRHAFEVAANQNGLNWKYIAGIYDKYRAHDVYTLEEAIAYEMAWNRGEIA